VYDRLAPELLRVALHLVRDAAEAEDVLQATFVSAIERAEKFDPQERVMPWLVGILGNEARRARETCGPAAGSATAREHGRDVAGARCGAT
jgi:DNA-directed RNA polymerase specialized sigma24 family protein